MKLNKIHADKRGEIYTITGEILKNPEITMLYTKAGISRGGCIHPQSIETLIVIEGEIEYVWGEHKEIMKSGDSITIPNNTPHYLTSITDSVVIEFGPSIEEKQIKHEEFRKKVEELNKNAHTAI